MRGKSLQLCLTLCNPMDCSLPGSSLHWILQARILEWVAMPSSRGSSRTRYWALISYLPCNGRQVLYHWHHLGSPYFSGEAPYPMLNKWDEWNHCLASNLKNWKSLSHVQFFATPRTMESMEFSRPEYWSGQPFPSLGDLPNPGIKPRSPTLQVDSLPGGTIWLFTIKRGVSYRNTVYQIEKVLFYSFLLFADNFFYHELLNFVK